MDPVERVIRIGIPDDAVQSWIKIFSRLGLTHSQVERIMIRLNDSFARRKLQRFIDYEMEVLEASYQSHRGRPLDEQRKSMARDMILEQLRSIPVEDLERGVRKR